MNDRLQFSQRVQLLEGAAHAAIAYDNAIEACANSPQSMSSFCTAEGDSLDVLYTDWISKSRTALAFAAAPVQAQEPVPEAARQNGGLVRAALIDLMALERQATSACDGFKAQRDCNLRFARARKALADSADTAPVQPVAVPDGMSNKVRAFIDSVIEIGFEGDDVDGAAILEWAEDAGLIEARTMVEPCGEGQNCRCATDNDFPLTCYQKTYRRAAPAAQGDGEPEALLYAALNTQGRIVYSHESYENVDMNRRYIKTPTTIVGLAAIAAKAAS
ncbi:hypothetical protein [Janthinobacterium sp. UMAB-56]|uniref:hypothetical protein n=1 Tax=Janthinobacterium sp. UMAB-56 TaxID=1365361 RepID=UPI001C5693ED|nr:hypothetical protein [Janthinobacterium sp. UMAB-56]